MGRVPNLKIMDGINVVPKVRELRKEFTDYKNRHIQIYIYSNKLRIIYIISFLYNDSRYI